MIILDFCMILKNRGIGPVFYLKRRATGQAIATLTGSGAGSGSMRGASNLESTGVTMRVRMVELSGPPMMTREPAANKEDCFRRQGGSDRRLQ